MKIRTLIADDEALARDVIRLFLQSHPQIELVAECENGLETLQIIRQQQPDLVFLDVQMPELDGFGVLRQLKGFEGGIIFVTAYDKYALRAFEVHAMDYLLKPFERERFDEALHRAIAQLQTRQQGQVNHRLMALLEAYEPAKAAGQPIQPAYLQRLVIKEAGRIFFLKTEDIDWIESSDDYVSLHVGNKIHLLHETMAGLEQKLDPAQFLRIHRSTIVPIDRIKELIPHFNGEYFVILRNGTRLKLSRSYKNHLQSLLNSSF